MQGISTKVTAATLATAALVIINYVLFDATWGFEFPAFPDTVYAAINTLVIFASGYLVREAAPVVEPEPVVEDA